MPAQIPRYDGIQIQGSRSLGGGVFAAFDWEQMCLGPIPLGNDCPIRTKAANDRGRVDHFPVADRAQLIQVLGHYSKVQSSNSEDTVTWSVFGVARERPWLQQMMHLANFGPDAEAAPLHVANLWTRTAHPLTGQMQHGPEHDVLISGDQRAFFCECKWNSDIGTGQQGPNGAMDQVQMRHYSATQSGSQQGYRGALIIAPSPNHYACARNLNSCFRRYFSISPDGVGYVPTALGLQCEARAITWEQIALLAGNVDPELHDYLNWRIAML